MMLEPRTLGRAAWCGSYIYLTLCGCGGGEWAGGGDEEGDGGWGGDGRGGREIAEGMGKEQAD